MIKERLTRNGFSAQALSGDIPQRKRLKILERFMKGEIRALIGTDVASRGLHIEDVDCVILYDLPQNPEDYVHRIGRTARAGKKRRGDLPFLRGRRLLPGADRASHRPEDLVSGGRGVRAGRGGPAAARHEQGRNRDRKTMGRKRW